jgi:hypothetical protein
MLGIYVSKKRLLLLATSHQRELRRLAELSTNPSEPEVIIKASPERRDLAGRVRLRDAIHKRIEKYKRGVETP